MLQLISLAGFFFLFLVIQIAVFPSLNIPTLKSRQNIDVSPKALVLIIALVIVLAAAVTFFILVEDSAGSLLVLYAFIFAAGIFLDVFLALGTLGLAGRSLISIAASVAVVSLALVFHSWLFNDFLIATSLLWIGPVILKQFKIKRAYFLSFMAIFSIIDIINVFFLTPHISAPYNHLILNGYVVFGRFALGMGDFFLGYLAVCIFVCDKGMRKSIFLAVAISLPLLIINIIPFNHDIPYSIFITIPTLLMYLKHNISA